MQEHLLTCSSAVQAALHQAASAGTSTGGSPALDSSSSPCTCHGACNKLPCGLTLWTAVALLGREAALPPPLDSSRLPSPPPLLDAPLAPFAPGPAFRLHAWLEGLGARLTEEKHASKFYRRVLAGRTALEVSVSLGHLGVARHLLALGATVRPVVWRALVHDCPCGLQHDEMAALLVPTQARQLSVLCLPTTCTC